MRTPTVRFPHAGACADWIRHVLPTCVLPCAEGCCQWGAKNDPATRIKPLQVFLIPNFPGRSVGGCGQRPTAMSPAPPNLAPGLPCWSLRLCRVVRFCSGRLCARTCAGLFESGGKGSKRRGPCPLHDCTKMPDGTPSYIYVTNTCVRFCQVIAKTRPDNLGNVAPCHPHFGRSPC